MMRRLKQLGAVAVFALMLGAGLGSHHAQAAPAGTHVYLVSHVIPGHNGRLLAGRVMQR